MPEYYTRERHRFRLQHDTTWRPPQLGALTAAISHWTLDSHNPALVSIPTGSGKTAVAMAAPYVTPTPPSRVLIVVPSSDLRKQTADRFKNEQDLLLISALNGNGQEPLQVKRLTSRVHSWTELENADIVVALPNTISPHHYPNMPPPSDLFDLIIIDEAHHATAATWLEILRHFNGAYSLLLTATPIRRDGRSLPGKLVYYYPMRLALAAGFYKPIDPHLLIPIRPGELEPTDSQIAQHCAMILGQDEHSSSTLIIRAGTVERAEGLANLYKELGINVEPLHSRLQTAQRNNIIQRLRDGTLRGVSVVGMLGEGFDLPSLRILAYHDKHKSLPATIQLFGRLARSHADYPQPSVLVTVRDADVFPELQGVIRALYQEDPDWTIVLPRIVDSEIMEEQQDAEFAHRFAPTYGEIRPTQLNPLLRAVIYEITDSAWQPFFLQDETPPKLRLGSDFGGGQIVLSEHDRSSGMFLLVVKHQHQPRWNNDPTVQEVQYQLHIVAFRQAPTTDKKNLIFLNTEGEGSQNLLHEILGLKLVAVLISPEMIDAYVNSLERHSVSAVGVRNTNPAGRGTVGYRNYMGSGVHRGLRVVDTSRSALGHGNLQVAFLDGTTANGGFAVEKAKIWITRYLPLRQFHQWVEDASQRLWFPTIGPSGPLLPGVDRGRRLQNWPNARPLAAEMSPQIFGRSFTILHGEREYDLENVELRILNGDSPLTQGQLLNVQAIAPNQDGDSGNDTVIWEGSMESSGNWSATSTIIVRQGYAGTRDFVDLLRRHPPTIFFLDGSTVIGGLVYDSRYSGMAFDAMQVQHTNWTGVDITAETRRTASNRTPPAVSIHEHLEGWLISRPRIGMSRWVIMNDGSGEISDYIVIETLPSGEVHMSLWHAKSADSASASVRVEDFDKVVAQAIRSRHWFKSRRLWIELGNRLTGASSPVASLVAGSDDESELRVMLGIEGAISSEARQPWPRTMPVVRGCICIAQPGLSRQMYLAASDGNESARGVTQLLTVLKDTAHADALEILVLGSEN